MDNSLWTSEKTVHVFTSSEKKVMGPILQVHNLFKISVFCLTVDDVAFCYQ